jgi:hypothetical protein
MIDCPQCDDGRMLVRDGTVRCDRCYSGVEVGGDTAELVALLEQAVGADPDATDTGARAEQLTAVLLSGVAE